MVIAADYPFMDVLWTMLVFFGLVIWIWILIVILSDVFRRRDISGFAKVLWIIFVIVMPYLGVFVYLIVEHNGIADRRQADLAAAQTQMDDYVRSVAGGGGATAEIERAKQLLDAGTISQAEFDEIKRKALA